MPFLFCYKNLGSSECEDLATVALYENKYFWTHNRITAGASLMVKVSMANADFVEGWMAPSYGFIMG